jgi:hypothetical protein
MSSDNQLNEFINAQHAQNLTVMQALGRIEQAQKDTTQRLFGGDGQQGAIPYMASAAKELTVRVGALETWKTGTIKWVGGVCALLGAEGALLAFYFSHVSAKVQAAIGLR